MLLINQIKLVELKNENPWLNQITTIFTNSHQPLTNFPKAISYLNFKCCWQQTNLPSKAHKYKNLEARLGFLSHWPSLLVTIQNMPFSICFHSHNLMCPSYFLLGRWQIKCHLIWRSASLCLCPSLSLPLYFKNLTGHYSYF